MFSIYVYEKEVLVSRHLFMIREEIDVAVLDFIENGNGKLEAYDNCNRLLLAVEVER